MVTNESSGKVAVVTGAAGGIGRAAVERLLALGFRVCATDSSAEGLAAFAIAEGLMVQLLDVTRMDSVRRGEEAVMARWGRVDVLVNNAGLYERAPLAALEEAAISRLLDVNLVGAFRTSQVFTRDMIERKSGKVINVASIAALKGAAEAAHYAASKAGLLALSKSLAVELAPHNVQVNAILPGIIDTPMLAQNKDALKVLAGWRVPARKLGAPAEVAEVIGMLAAMQSGYVTGAEIIIDGGYVHG